MSVIAPAKTRWALPVVFGPKNGNLRFCVDYRKLSAVTIFDLYPLPKMDECMGSLGDANGCSTIDAICGHLQIEVDRSNRKKARIASHNGLYEFSCRPFGLKDAPTTFQRSMNMLLA